MATSSIDLGLRGLHNIEVIGSGGSAIVYKAVREVPGRFAMEETVAVKVLRSAWDAAARRRFEREQVVMDRLAETAGFVPILETGETDEGSPYIIMPYYKGGSLQQRIARNGPLDWPRAVRLVEQVAQTVADAHALDVFHRDIKPANILLSETGRPHMADFGISLIADDAASRAASTAAFTPAYSPPESFTDGLLPVAATDIYGLAATLWAILAGHAPFKEPGERPAPVTVFGRVAMHQVGDLRDRVPSPICHFIERSMAKRPENRPLTMIDFLSELQAAREDAYRGVEAPRLEPDTLIVGSPDDADEDIVDLPEANEPDGENHREGEGGGKDKDQPGSSDSLDDGWDSTAYDLDGVRSVASGSGQAVNSENPNRRDIVGDPVASSSPSGASILAAEDDAAELIGFTDDDAAGGSRWLFRVLVAAIVTLLLLFGAWWLLGPRSDANAEDSDSALVVADDGAIGSRRGALGDGEPSQSAGKGNRQGADAAISEDDGAEDSETVPQGQRNDDERANPTEPVAASNDLAVRGTSSSTTTTPRRDTTTTANPSSSSPNLASGDVELTPVGVILDGNNLPDSDDSDSNDLNPDEADPSESDASADSTPEAATTTSQTATSLVTTTTAPASTTTARPSSSPIAFVTSPYVVSITDTSLVFAYTTNGVCGTGSFEYINVETGRSVGSWLGDRGCYGPLHHGESRWPGVALEPNTTYRVNVTVEGQPGNGTLATGTGQVSTSFQVTTPAG